MKDLSIASLVFKLKVEPIGFDVNQPVSINNPQYGKKFVVSDKFEISGILSHRELKQSSSVNIEAHMKDNLKRKVFEKLFTPLVEPILSDLHYLLNQPNINRCNLHDLYRKIDSLKYNYIELDEK